MRCVCVCVGGGGGGGGMIDKTIEFVWKPRCTEHPPVYSWYPPQSSWYAPGVLMTSPRYTKHPPVQSGYPYGVLMISRGVLTKSPPLYSSCHPRCTAHPTGYCTDRTQNVFVQYVSTRISILETSLLFFIYQYGCSNLEGSIYIWLISNTLSISKFNYGT